MPNCSAMALAVRSSSPVSIMTLSPRLCRVLMASGVVVLIGSATAISPARRPSIATPTRATVSLQLLGLVRQCINIACVPFSKQVVGTDDNLLAFGFLPKTPPPVTDSKSATDSRNASPVLWLRVQWPGQVGAHCSVPRQPPSRNTSVSENDPTERHFRYKRGRPSVSVPVLSTTSVSTFSKVSSTSAFLMSTPSFAPDQLQP